MISVIIPVYNAEAYLKRCVDSVLNQSYTDIELLLIDDGSTDDSGALCDQYVATYDKIRAFHKKNGGVSSARNLGLDNALGEYVMFLDSDDMMEPGMCALMVDVLQSRGADIVICGTKETGGSLWAPSEDKDYSLQELKEDGFYMIGSELLSPPWNKVYKRSLINNRFDEKTSFGEDLVFNLGYLSGCKKISLIPHTPFFHTKDNCDSLSCKVYPRRLKEIELYRSALADFFPLCVKAVSKKYIHDLSVYTRLLFKAYNSNVDTITPELNDWRERTALSIMSVLNSRENMYNKVVLIGMKFGWWHVVRNLLDSASLIRGRCISIYGNK